MKPRKLPALAMLLIITLFASCCSLQRYNDEKDFLINVLDDETVEITGYVGTSKNVRIPPRINELPVAKIGEAAFTEKGLARVTIPNSVIVIGDEAFSWNELASAAIPQNVTHIGARAFFHNRLTRVTIPQTIVEIGVAAFAVNKLRKITLPDNITFINNTMFADNRLTGITIPEGVVSIGGSAFMGNRLTRITIPKNVASIGSYAFFHNHRLTRITIGENVKLGYRGFKGFDSFYNNAVVKKGGTYTYGNYHWSPEDKTIPVLRFSSDMTGEFSNIAFLTDMPDLEDVFLRDNDLLTDITPLSGLTKIKKLLIYDCPNIESIGPLSSLINLKELYLDHENNYDYSALVPLRQLERLEISNYGGEKTEIDLGHIGQLHSLRSLSIDGNIKIINIRGLQHLVNLAYLEMDGIINSDISWMSGLHNLTGLSVSSWTIDDISPLASLPNLVSVGLAGSNIKDISPLLKSNSIRYIRALAHEVEAGISDNLKDRFERQGADVNTAYDDR